MFFSTLVFVLIFIKFGAQLDPKSDRIAFRHLGNFGKRLALVAATCLSSCSGVFRDHFWRILEHVGTIFVEIRQDLDGLAEIF